MTREQVLEMGYVPVGKSLSLEIFAYFHKDGMVSICQFETDIPSVVQDCGSVLLSEEIFHKIIDMTSVNKTASDGSKMKLIQKEFKTDLMRDTNLLVDASKSKLREHSMIIMDDITQDALVVICNRNSITFIKHKNLRFALNVDNIEDMIEDFITAKSFIKGNKNIFINTNRPVDFKKFEKVQGLSIYHYFQK